MPVVPKCVSNAHRKSRYRMVKARTKALPCICALNLKSKSFALLILPSVARKALLASPPFLEHAALNKYIFLTDTKAFLCPPAALLR